MSKVVLCSESLEDVDGRLRVEFLLVKVIRWPCGVGGGRCGFVHRFSPFHNCLRLVLSFLRGYRLTSKRCHGVLLKVTSMASHVCLKREGRQSRALTLGYPPYGLVELAFLYCFYSSHP